MTANIQERIDYWNSSAQYDIITAEAMLKTKRYLYVGFCCHLAVEKLTKAYYWKEIKDEPPFTHNLNMLLSKLSLKSSIPVNHQELLDELIPLNIKTRYPEDKEKIFTLLNYNRCRTIIKKTKEFIKWIQELLNQ